MKSQKASILVVCIISALLLYVMGSMYMNNADQAGGGASASSNDTSGGGSGQTGSNNNTNSPGDSGGSGDASLQQSPGSNQIANPTGTQTNSAPGVPQQQTVPVITQPITAPEQSTAGNANSNPGTAGQNSMQQSQSNSVNNSQLQTTPNPSGGMP